MVSFNQHLLEVQKNQNSLVCVGLDPDLDKIPKHLLKLEDPLFEFSRAIIDATSDIVCAYKPNFAFYEAYGVQGWAYLKKTAELIPKKVISIADAKRGDIGNSSERYAKSIFDELGFESVTVNPYMGTDGVEPFLKNPEKGAFFLCLTSNEGAKDIQFLSAGVEKVFLKVTRKVIEWNKNDNAGLVVGATQAEQLKSIRFLAPRIPMLIPGIGVQGGDLENTVKFGCDSSGYNAIINVSRSVIYASQGKDFAEKAREEVIRLNNQINKIRATP